MTNFLSGNKDRLFQTLSSESKLFFLPYGLYFEIQQRQPSNYNYNNNYFLCFSWNSVRVDSVARDVSKIASILLSCQTGDSVFYTKK